MSENEAPNYSLEAFHDNAYCVARPLPTSTAVFASTGELQLGEKTPHAPRISERRCITAGFDVRSRATRGHLLGRQQTRRQSSKERQGP